MILTNFQEMKCMGKDALCFEHFLTFHYYVKFQADEDKSLIDYKSERHAAQLGMKIFLNVTIIMIFSNE
jgi:hypothetical protein